MAFEQADIVAIQQPIDLLTTQRHQLITGFRPLEFLFSQPFVIQHKTTVFPQQTPDLIALPIGKRIQRAGEWIGAQAL